MVSVAAKISFTGPRTIAESVAAFANFFAKGGKISRVKRFFMDKMSSFVVPLLGVVDACGWTVEFVGIIGGCCFHVAVNLQPPVAIRRIRGSHLFSQGLQGKHRPAIAFHAGVSSSLWISITSCRGSGTSITGRSGAGAAFALALASGFTVGTAAFEGAQLGVGDTHLVALVDLVGVAGEGIGVALRPPWIARCSCSFSQKISATWLVGSDLHLKASRLTTRLRPLISITLPMKIFSFISTGWYICCSSSCTITTSSGAGPTDRAWPSTV